MEDGHRLWGGIMTAIGACMVGFGVWMVATSDLLSWNALACSFGLGGSILLGGIYRLLTGREE